jgi:hypothetical protein
MQSQMTMLVRARYSASPHNHDLVQSAARSQTSLIEGDREQNLANVLQLEQLQPSDHGAPFKLDASSDSTIASDGDVRGQRISETLSHDQCDTPLSQLALQRSDSGEKLPSNTEWGSDAASIAAALDIVGETTGSGENTRDSNVRSISESDVLEVTARGLEFSPRIENAMRLLARHRYVFLKEAKLLRSRLRANMYNNYKQLNVRVEVRFTDKDMQWALRWWVLQIEKMPDYFTEMYPFHLGQPKTDIVSFVILPDSYSIDHPHLADTLPALALATSASSNSFDNYANQTKLKEFFEGGSQTGVSCNRTGRSGRIRVPVHIYNIIPLPRHATRGWSRAGVFIEPQATSADAVACSDINLMREVVAQVKKLAHDFRLAYHANSKAGDTN